MKGRVPHSFDYDGKEYTKEPPKFPDYLLAVSEREVAGGCELLCFGASK